MIGWHLYTGLDVLWQLTAPHTMELALAPSHRDLVVTTGTNAAELATLGIASPVLSVPRGDALGPEVQAAMAPIVAALRHRAGG